MQSHTIEFSEYFCFFLESSDLSSCTHLLCLFLKQWCCSVESLKLLIIKIHKVLRRLQGINIRFFLTVYKVPLSTSHRHWFDKSLTCVPKLRECNPTQNVRKYKQCQSQLALMMRNPSKTERNLKEEHVWKVTISFTVPISLLLLLFIAVALQHGFTSNFLCNEVFLQACGISASLTLDHKRVLPHLGLTVFFLFDRFSFLVLLHFIWNLQQQFQYNFILTFSWKWQN